MGFAKDEGQRADDNMNRMSELLVSLDYLSKCPHDVYVQENRNDSKEIVDDELSGEQRAEFGSDADAIAAVEAAFANAATECGQCEKNMGSDD